MRCALAVVMVIASGCGSPMQLTDAGSMQIPSDAGPAVSGALVINWKVSKDGMTRTCAEAGVDQVWASLSPPSGPDSIDRYFPCSAGTGTIEDVPFGAYALSVTPVAADGSTTGNSQGGLTLFDATDCQPRLAEACGRTVSLDLPVN